jgi:asparagine synthase (glutamine-hydrolysing)
MCGIVAAWGKDTEGTVREMLGRIHHRGPDGWGVTTVGNACLGHVRLAIVDVEGGAQPMRNEVGDIAVTFNGEIYNHKELRGELREDHHFATQSDTEVLLHLFEEQGRDMLKKLDGMFALALASPEGLLLARDPIGIKPLYYGWRGGTFLAASEIKAFPTMEEIHTLAPGHALTPLKGARPFVRPLDVASSGVPKSLDEARSEVRRLLERAVVKRLMADVPVGVFLSGGLDSSLIAALMRPHVRELHSFVAGIEGAPDLEAARSVSEALGTVHHEAIYTPGEMEEALPEVIRALESFDAPLVRSAIPGYFVSRLASRYVKVVLGGEGADEIFAGYEYLRQFRGAKLKQELLQITRKLHDTNLQRTDRMTMTFGIEGRVPFLDMDLVRYVLSLPAPLLEPGDKMSEKWLLRDACRGLIPPEILSRKKMKFSAGAGSSGILAERARALISPAVFTRDRQASLSLRLRSREELWFYRIWKEVMGPGADPRLVGRTRDLSAATEEDG